jgi:hypothetical protein
LIFYTKSYSFQLSSVYTVFMYQLFDEIIGFYEDTAELFYEPYTWPI